MIRLNLISYTVITLSLINIQCWQQVRDGSLLILACVVTIKQIVADCDMPF